MLFGYRDDYPIFPDLGHHLATVVDLLLDSFFVFFVAVPSPASLEYIVIMQRLLWARVVVVFACEYSYWYSSDHIVDYAYICMRAVRYMEVLLSDHSLSDGCFSRMIICISITPRCSLSP